MRIGGIDREWCGSKSSRCVPCYMVLNFDHLNELLIQTPKTKPKKLNLKKRESTQNIYPIKCCKW